MVTMTVSLPEPMKDWIDSQVSNGEYASASDYVRDLVRRDRQRRGHGLTLEELRQILAESRASGAGTLDIEALFEEAAKRVLKMET